MSLPAILESTPAATLSTGSCARTERRVAAGGVAPLGGTFSAFTIAHRSVLANGKYQPSPESGKPRASRQSKANEICPQVQAFLVNELSALPARLTSAEAAYVLHLSRKTVRNLIYQGKLSSLAHGTSRICAASVLAYRNERTRNV